MIQLVCKRDSAKKNLILHLQVEETDLVRSVKDRICTFWNDCDAQHLQLKIEDVVLQDEHTLHDYELPNHAELLVTRF